MQRSRNSLHYRMKPQMETSTQEVLAGLVERVTYHNAENGFCVLHKPVPSARPAPDSFSDQVY